MSRSFRLALAAGACLALPCLALPCIPALAATAAPPPAERADVWPQSYSDLPADPAIRFGVLPNGMRYALMHNDTPKGQTALRLRIGSGALEESGDEQGLAHVLEHMAFKGSVHAPNGEMVKMLERKGLSFGGDTNARTEQTQTVYQLDLPESDAATLDLGLTLMRDVGGGLLLAPDALQGERGVVLSEERLRDTPEYEAMKARLAFQLKGQLAADRMPIGLTSIIEHAPASLVRKVYDANYRPDRATLVVVGDFDVAAMQAKIERLFGDWRPVGPETAAPDLGQPPARGASFQLIVREGVTPSLAIAWATPHDAAPDSVAKERRDLVENLAFAVLNRRFARLSHAPDPPFLGASASRNDVAQSARLTTVDVLLRPADWRAALTAAVTTQRQALAYGFTQAEVDREVLQLGVSLRNAAAAASTRRSPAIAEEIVRTADDQSVDTAPAEDLKLYARFTDHLSAAEVTAAFRNAFGGSGPLVSLATPEPVDGGEGALAAAFSAAEAAPVAPLAAGQVPVWTHTRFGAPGQVVQTRQVSDLGVTFVRFANGVRLTVKPTRFAKDQVLVKVDFGRGRLGEPSDRQEPDWALSAFTAGGLRDLSYEDLQQALADRTVSMGLGIDDDAYTLGATTRPADLDTQLQLLAAYMTAPGWRPEAIDHVKGLMALTLDQLSATPQGVQARDLPALEHGGDQRWTYPTAAEARSTGLGQLKALLEPELKGGPLEVVIAGDTTVEAAVKAVAATFAALPARPALPPLPGAERVRFPAGDRAPVVRLHHGRPDHALAYIAWPAADQLSDTQRARRINMAAEVLQLRLTDQIRIAEGASYSPAAGAAESETFPGYGYIFANVETPPARVAGFYADVAKITAALRTDGISPDELQRAVRPRIEAIQKAQQTNGYWTAMLHDADRDPRRLDLIRTSVSGYQTMTAADVQQAAQAYLGEPSAWRFEVEPPNPAPAAPGTKTMPVPKVRPLAPGLAPHGPTLPPAPTSPTTTAAPAAGAAARSR